MTLEDSIIELCQQAKEASYFLSTATTEQKNNALEKIALSLTRNQDIILNANVKDLQQAQKDNLSTAMIDRLMLNGPRIESMIKSVYDLKDLPDPTEKVLETITRPNGLTIEKVTVPIGVIGIIYESRPNVTLEAATLCLKSSNTVILRGGKESFHSNIAIVEAIHCGLRESEFSTSIVNYIPTIQREATNYLLKQNKTVDLIIPRGGESLIRAVMAQSTIPVLKHYKGVCHLYVEKDYEFEAALEMILNAKAQRPSACNAIETLLLQEDFARQNGAELALILRQKQIQILGCEQWQKLDPLAPLSTQTQLDNEFLDLKLNIKIVKNIKEAIVHINEHGSQHSDAILTHNIALAEEFLKSVKSAVVYHNASTRFTDGGEFGFGAEMGISTDKIHARGPVGLRELCTYQYRVRGNGQVRK